MAETLTEFVVRKLEEYEGGTMACMEHWCTHCDFVDFNNSPNTPARCPKCGGTDFMRLCDEQFDREDREEADCD